MTKSTLNHWNLYLSYINDALNGFSVFTESLHFNAPFPSTTTQNGWGYSLTLTYIILFTTHIYRLNFQNLTLYFLLFFSCIWPFLLIFFTLGQCRGGIPYLSSLLVPLHLDLLKQIRALFVLLSGSVPCVIWPWT